MNKLSKKGTIHIKNDNTIIVCGHISSLEELKEINAVALKYPEVPFDFYSQFHKEFADMISANNLCIHIIMNNKQKKLVWSASR